MPTKSLKLLFVVHRYYPYPGGSEYNVKRLAEAAVSLGHDVTVLTDVHAGDQNGVKVTDDRQIAIGVKWDLVIIHGSCPTQDWAHANALAIKIQSPVYYLLVQPSNSQISQGGMHKADWIGCGTTFDLDHVAKYGHLAKARPFRYPIDPELYGEEGFREKVGIKTPYMFLSAGGFWPHKRMDELVKAFNEAGRTDVTLVLLGYDTNHGTVPPQSEYVMAFECGDPQEVANALIESDLYIMNSDSEGYGLMILEAMYNGVPWMARDIAGAHDLADRGKVYTTYEQLVENIKTWVPASPYVYTNLIMPNMVYVEAEHNPLVSIKDILSVLEEA